MTSESSEHNLNSGIVIESFRSNFGFDKKFIKAVEVSGKCEENMA